MSPQISKLFHVIGLVQKGRPHSIKIMPPQMFIILVLDKGEAHDPDPGHLHVLFYDLTKDDFECKSADFYDCCGENKTLRIADLLLDVSDKGEIKVNYM